MKNSSAIWCAATWVLPKWATSKRNQAERAALGKIGDAYGQAQLEQAAHLFAVGATRKRSNGQVLR
jgi:hypothetical protein